MFIFAYGKRHDASRHHPLKQRRKGSIRWVYTNTAVLPCSLSLVFVVRLSKNNHEDSHHFLEASLNGLLLINCQEIIPLKPCFRFFVFVFVCLFVFKFLFCSVPTLHPFPHQSHSGSQLHTIPTLHTVKGAGESPRSRSGPRHGGAPGGLQSLPPGAGPEALPPAGSPEEPWGCGSSPSRKGAQISRVTGLCHL